MMNKLMLTTTPDTAGQRLDAWLTAQLEDTTRSAVQRLCDEGCVTLASENQGKVLTKSYKLRGNESISVLLPEPQEADAIPQNIPLDVVYEDDDLLIVNKPKGMVVHPAAGNPDGTLVNALLYHCKDGLSGIGGVMRPGIVHRIDKDTSGLLMVAKNDRSHNRLSAQIKAHSFLREYEAIVYGNLKSDFGVINAPIGRHPVHRKKMCVTQQNAREAVTYYEVIARYNGFTHICCRLETGRTHQIRVHLAYLGHPVAGDAVYGPKKVLKNFNGQCLHARKVGFIHPKTGEYLEFTSDLPAYFSVFLAQKNSVND